ncbi:hypothetical protein NMY22_g13900 [Coprinellus aureogranulatus]|nr:hypothetical protein NMY22_g13900 [Coprinellus aureogranulatus]
MGMHIGSSRRAARLFRLRFSLGRFIPSQTPTPQFHRQGGDWPFRRTGRHGNYLTDAHQLKQRASRRLDYVTPIDTTISPTGPTQNVSGATPSSAAAPDDQSNAANETAANVNDKGSEGHSRHEDDKDAFAFFIDPAARLMVSTLLLFPSYTPAQILGVLYIQNAILQFRQFVIVILMINNSDLSPRQKARLIDDAILRLLTDWCIGTLSARILAGEALKVADVDAHVKAFEATMEVGVVLSIASQVDLGYVPKKTREKGWKKFFDETRRRYYVRKVLRPLRDAVRSWYQDLLASCIEFALAAFRKDRWFPDFDTYWKTDGPLLKLYVKLLAITSGYLHFATEDPTQHDFVTSPFIHEARSVHLDAVSTDVLIKRLRSALARGDDTELGRLFVLRGAPLQATSSHVLSRLAKDSPISVVNYVNMANPYIAPNASSTTWHAPLTAFSAAILTLVLGAIGKYGSSVTAAMILQDAYLMELFHRKGIVTLEFINPPTDLPQP